MALWLGEPTINYEESGFELEALSTRRARDDDEVLGFEVKRTSHGTAATITFDEVFVAGPTVPGIEWHVVVYGPEISSNSDLILGDTDFNTWRHTGTDAQLYSDYTLRGRFYTMPYDAVVLEVAGFAVIDADAPENRPPAMSRRAFTATTMVVVDGVEIQAVAFPTVANGVVSSMMNPRVFADFVGATVDWNEATRTATFTGTSTHGIQQTVVLTLDSPTATVNGSPVDIATGAGQGQLAGQIRPVVINGRSYVPARFLAGIFGVPIDFQTGTVILG
jgi:hypothetical protein